MQSRGRGRQAKAVARAPKRVQEEAEVATEAPKKSQKIAVVAKAGEILVCNPCGDKSSDLLARRLRERHPLAKRKFQCCGVVCRYLC